MAGASSVAGEVFVDALPYFDQGYDAPGVREAVSKHYYIFMCSRYRSLYIFWSHVSVYANWLIGCLSEHKGIGTLNRGSQRWLATFCYSVSLSCFITVYLSIVSFT